MVGDTTFDVEMAKAAGALAIGAAWGYHEADELRAAGADAIAASLADLPGLLERLGGLAG
jgi:phosphoglycolate phosphatase